MNKYMRDKSLESILNKIGDIDIDMALCSENIIIELRNIFHEQNTKAIALALGFIIGEFEIECGCSSKDMIDTIKEIANAYIEYRKSVYDA